MKRKRKERGLLIGDAMVEQKNGGGHTHYTQQLPALTCRWGLVVLVC